VTVHTDGGNAGTMTDTHSALSRRSLLRTGALGDGAAVLAAYTAGTADGTAAVGRAALAAATSPAPPLMQNLFTLPDLDFETLFVFGSIGYGCAEFGELVTVVNQINAAGASYQTYYEAFRLR
jgi:hypothetical protein